MLLAQRIHLDADINAVSWSRDGLKVAVLSNFGGDIRIYSSKDWSEINHIKRYGGAYAGNSLSFLDPNVLLLSAPIGVSPYNPSINLDGFSLEAIDANTGKHLRYIKNPIDDGSRRVMDKFTLAPSGKQVAGIPTGALSQVDVLSTRDWSLEENIDLGRASDNTAIFASALSFSPVKHQIAIGAIKGIFEIFDQDAHKVVFKKNAFDYNYAVQALEYDRSGLFLAVGGSMTYGMKPRTTPGLKVFFADNLDLDPIGFDLDAKYIISLSWSPEGSLAVGADNGLFVVNVNGKIIKKYADALEFYSVKYSPDGHQLVAAAASNLFVYSSETSL